MEDYLKKRIENSRNNYRQFFLFQVIVSTLLIVLGILSGAWGLIFLLFPVHILFLVPGITEYQRCRKYKEELNDLYKQKRRESFYRGYEDFFNSFKNEKNEQWSNRDWGYYNSQARSQSANFSYISAEVTEAYRFFGLPTNSGEADVKSAYRKLALKYHPDHGGNAEKFKLLVKHKEVLYRYLGIK